MPRIRLALAQVNPTVGDLAGNAEIVAGWSRRAVAQGADLVAFPEMVLTGYPVEDLALRPSFVIASSSALHELAGRLADDGCGGVPVVVGFLGHSQRDLPRLGRPTGSPQNAAAVLYRGAVVARYAKHHLPNYGVFDEFRYFVPGERLSMIRVRGVDVALAICEDLWQEGGPVSASRAAKAGLLLVINGSPYERGKTGIRQQLGAQRADEAGCTLAYVNMVGGQDELVFDGGSFVVSRDGVLLARAPQFEEALLLADLELPGARLENPSSGEISVPGGDVFGVMHAVLTGPPGAGSPPSPPEGDSATQAPLAEELCDEAEVYGALVTGLRDYVRKNDFRSVVLGLSGGIDSALVAVIAVDALGPEAVYGVSMPSEYSSGHSQDDAAELAQRTGLAYRTVAIAPLVSSFLAQLGLTGLAEENLQARVRGVTLMGLSNQEGHLVLTTGNKTELAVGYSTIYGDAVGGYAPLKDVPKTTVWALSRWRDAVAVERGQTPPIPENSITKPPSAELRPGQLDTDSLPDYALLDDVLEDYVAQDRGAAELVADGFEPALVERVLRMTDTAEYKRRQYPPGPKISLKAFGRDRRLPITNRWRESAPPPA